MADTQETSQEPALRRGNAPWFVPMVVGLVGLAVVVTAFVVLPALMRGGAPESDPVDARYPPLELQRDREYLGDRVNILEFGLRMTAPKDWERLNPQALAQFAVAVDEGPLVAGWGSPRHAGVMLLHEIEPRVLAEARRVHGRDLLVALKKAHLERSEANDNVTAHSHGTFSVRGIRVARIEEVRADDTERMAVVRYFFGAPFEKPFGMYVMCHEQGYNESFQRSFLAVLASMSALELD